MDTTGIDKLIPQMTTFGGRRPTPVLRSVTEWGSYPVGYPTRESDILCSECAGAQVDGVRSGEATFDPGEMVTGDVVVYEAPPDDDVMCPACGRVIAEGASE